MTDFLPARQIRRHAEGGEAVDHVTLDYDARLIRRKRLTTVAGVGVLVDLAETVSLDQGDYFVLEDGRLIGVRAAEEPLIAVTGDLARLAWHIGNRHTPCQIEPGRLLIREDRVLAGMLEGLGAALAHLSGPFTPEGGAYGHGRTMGHEHGEHDHGGHEHGGHDHGAPEHGHHAHHHGAHHHLDEEDGEDEPEVIR